MLLNNFMVALSKKTVRPQLWSGWSINSLLGGMLWMTHVLSHRWVRTKTQMRRSQARRIKLRTSACLCLPRTCYPSLPAPRLAQYGYLEIQRHMKAVVRNQCKVVISVYRYEYGIQKARLTVKLFAVRRNAQHQYRTGG